MKKTGILAILTILALLVTAVVPAFAEEAANAVAIDKEAFDALLAAGPVAADEEIAASEWATAVKNAGVLRVGGTRTSSCSASWTRRTTGSAASMPACTSCWPGISWAMKANMS